MNNYGPAISWAVMTRRSFTAAMTAGLAAGRGDDIVLEAIYGAKLPATLRLSRRVASQHRYFELRTYAGSTAMEGIFARAGLRAHRLAAQWRAAAATSFDRSNRRPPSLCGGLEAPMRFLIPFDSLEQRSQAWHRFNSDSEWALVRGLMRLTGMTIYRQPGGRIFEMSL